MCGFFYLLTFRGRYSEVFLSCSLCRKKFLLRPSAALALKERLLVCLQSQNPTVKSGVVRGSCMHASKTKQMFAFPLQTPLGMHGVLLARKNSGLVGVHEGPQVIFTSTVWMLVSWLKRDICAQGQVVLSYLAACLLS